MTKAAEEFQKSICDVEVLLKILVKMMSSELEQDQIHILKRAGLVIAMATWETYIKDCARELYAKRLEMLSGFEGVPIDKYRATFDKDLEHFYNPNTERTREFFLVHLKRNVTTHWAEAQFQLDKWIEKRGEAAHVAPKKGNNEEHLLSKKELEKIVEGLIRLVEVMENALSEPWP